MLGTDHPSASAPPDEVASTLQEMALEYVWGGLWARDTLSRRERSIATLSMLTALNRPHQLRDHVRAGLNNGLTRDEILEVLLHAVVYCGFPAAVDAMNHARRVLDREEE